MKKQNNPTPLVVGDLSWADTIPDWLLNEIKAERMAYGLAKIMDKDVPKVGNAEVCAYLMTSSLRAPLRYEYTEIYIYLTAKVMQKRDTQLEPLFKEKLDKGLTDWEQRELDELKSDIYSKRGGEVNHPLLNIMRDFKKAVPTQKGIEAQRTLVNMPKRDKRQNI